MNYKQYLILIIFNQQTCSNFEKQITINEEVISKWEMIKPTWNHQNHEKVIKNVIFVQNQGFSDLTWFQTVSYSYIY